MIIKSTSVIISTLKFKCWCCYESKVNIFITKSTRYTTFFYFISNSESTYLPNNI